MLCVLIIRNGSCKQDMYQRRTLSYVPMYAVGEFYLAEINAFCNKKKKKKKKKDSLNEKVNKVMPMATD